MTWNGENATIGPNSSKNYMYGNSIYIFDEITNENMAYLLGDFTTFVLSSENTNKEIKIFINSPGGMTSVCFGFLGVMNIGRMNGIKFTTYILGNACSCASMIACAGDYRVMTQYSNHMIHFGYYGDCITKTSEIEKLKNNVEMWHSKAIDHYLTCTHGKMSIKELEEKMEDEQSYICASDCLKYGLVDAVIEYDLFGKNEEEQKIKDRFEAFEKWEKEEEKKAKNERKKAKLAKKSKKNTK